MDYRGQKYRRQCEEGLQCYCHDCGRVGWVVASLWFVGVALFVVRMRVLRVAWCCCRATCLLISHFVHVSHHLFVSTAFLINDCQDSRGQW